MAKNGEAPRTINFFHVGSNSIWTYDIGPFAKLILNFDFDLAERWNGYIFIQPTRQPPHSIKYDNNYNFN